MARRPARTNLDWETPEGDRFRWEHVAIEVLMDIRAELKRLNATLSCHRVPRGMDALHRIDRRLQKHMPLKPGRARR